MRFKKYAQDMNIYDILKTALTTHPWQCHGWGDYHSRPTIREGY